MKKQLYYRQCLLVKKVPDGVMQQVSWIPEPYCKEGKVLKLREEGSDVWTDGWVVKSPSEPREAEKIEHDCRLYLKTRKASDI
jgi:hypothetical protein